MAGQRDIPTASPQTRWILWGAMTNSLFFFLLVGYVVRSQGEPPALDPNTLWLLTLLLGGVGVLVSLVNVFWVKQLTKKASYPVYQILRLALGEVVGIFGMLLFFMGADWTVFLVFLGWALLLQLGAMPTDSSVEEYERQRRLG